MHAQASKVLALLPLLAFFHYSHAELGIVDVVRDIM